MDKVNLAEKLALIGETWSPKIVGQVGGCQVKLVKIVDEFVWHAHQTKVEKRP